MGIIGYAAGQNGGTSKVLPNARIARLKLCVGGKLEGESSKGEGEDALVVVVDAGVRGAEGLVDLLDGRRHFGAIEQDVAAQIELCRLFFSIL